MKRKRAIIDGLASFLLLTMLLVINDLTEMVLDATWVTDINVWINDFFVNTTVFLATSTFLSRIPNKYFQFIMSYAMTITIGNFICFDATNVHITPWLIFFVIIDVGSLMLCGWSGYTSGEKKARRKLEAAKRAYIGEVLQMDNDTRSNLYNLSRFIKKHPKECAAIDEFGVDFVMEFIKDDKAIRKAAKNDPTNKTTN